MGKHLKGIGGLLLTLLLTGCSEKLITPVNAVATVSNTTMPATILGVANISATIASTPSLTAAEVVITPQPDAFVNNKTVALPQATLEPIELKFGELLSPKTTPINLLLSDQALAAKGKRVKLTGYVSLSQKPEIEFTILTNNKSISCSCCYTAGDLPFDLVLLKLPAEIKPDNFGELTTFTGQFEVGDEVDAGTGIVTLFRLKVESYSVVKAARNAKESSRN